MMIGQDAGGLRGYCGQRGIDDGLMLGMHIPRDGLANRDRRR